MQEMQETWVQFLGQDDPLEKEMATHSGILSWEIPWTEEPGRLQSVRSQRVGHDWVTEHSAHSTRSIWWSLIVNCNEYQHWRRKTDQIYKGGNKENKTHRLCITKNASTRNLSYKLWSVSLNTFSPVYSVDMKWKHQLLVFICFIP